MNYCHHKKQRLLLSGSISARQQKPKGKMADNGLHHDSSGSPTEKHTSGKKVGLLTMEST